MALAEKLQEPLTSTQLKKKQIVAVTRTLVAAVLQMRGSMHRERVGAVRPPARGSMPLRGFAGFQQNSLCG